MASYNTFRSVLQTGRVHGDNETFETVQVRSFGCSSGVGQDTFRSFRVHTKIHITSKTSLSSHLSANAIGGIRIPPNCPYIVSFHGLFWIPSVVRVFVL